MKKGFGIAMCAMLIFSVILSAAPDTKNKVRYEKYKQDPVMKEILDGAKALQKAKDKTTGHIKKCHQAKKKKDREERRMMKTDLNGVYPPKSKKSFKKMFHFPPQAQYMTSTCWSYSATSFYESEIFRLTGKNIKLSEMWTPYFELLAKCHRFITTRGNSYVAGGGESNALPRIWKKHGLAPLSAYSGLLKKEAKHNHGPVMKEIRGYLKYIKANNLWDEEDNLQHIRLILDKHLGAPPTSFDYEGKTYTPHEFLKMTGLDMDAYYSTMSTSYFPFYTMQEFKVPDNWWHSEEYVNLPLETWYKVIKKAMAAKYTIIIGGDVSEPGKYGEKDIAFIPSYDIPQAYINQDSREFRIYNRTTQDDHGIHMVGHTRYKGKDWYLIKDSGRSARKGKKENNGYYFFREDFIKLKMLTFTVHKDMLKDILPKVKKTKKTCCPTTCAKTCCPTTKKAPAKPCCTPEQAKKCCPTDKKAPAKPCCTPEQAKKCCPTEKKEPAKPCCTKEKK